MNCLRPLKHWVSGFEFQPRHGCLCVFILFVLLCVYVEALRWADPPSRESYRLCIGLRNWKSGQGPTKGCRAIVIIVIIIMELKFRNSSLITLLLIWWSLVYRAALQGMFSRLLNSKHTYSGINSPVSWPKITNVSGIILVPIIKMWCDTWQQDHVWYSSDFDVLEWSSLYETP
jgi:hypothetical protein